MVNQYHCKELQHSFLFYIKNIIPKYKTKIEADLTFYSSSRRFYSKYARSILRVLSCFQKRVLICLILGKIALDDDSII